jgi:hypothetical protein
VARFEARFKLKGLFVLAWPGKQTGLAWPFPPPRPGSGPHLLSFGSEPGALAGGARGDDAMVGHNIDGDHLPSNIHPLCHLLTSKVPPYIFLPLFGPRASCS